MASNSPGAFDVSTVSRIWHRCEALYIIEDQLSDARTAAQVLHGPPQTDPASSKASQAESADEIRQRAIEEVTSVKAEVAARSEGLLCLAMEAVAKATLEQAEYRDAVNRARLASDERYRAAA